MTQTNFVLNEAQLAPSSGESEKAKLAFSHVHMGLHQYTVTVSMLTFAMMMKEMVLKLVAEAHKPIVNHENYALSVIQSFIVIALLPLLVGSHDLAQQTEQNSAFQGSMSEMQSFFTYIESLANSKDILPSGWNTSAVGASKLNQLMTQFYQMFYEGPSTNPTWADMSFEMRDPSSPTGFTKVPFIDPKTGHLQLGIQKILVAFNSYFSSTTPGASPSILPDPSTITASSGHIPDVLMLLFTDMEAKMSGKIVQPMPEGGYDFAKAYGIENADGTITGSSFASADSSIGAANNLWIALNNPICLLGKINYSDTFAGALYKSYNSANHAPTEELVAMVYSMALEYLADKTSTDGAGALASFDNIATTAQQEADKEGQDLMTTLQSIGQTMSTEVETGQSIASNAAKGTDGMVARQIAS